MKKRTYIIIGSLIFLGVISLVVLKSYSLEIVHAVVRNALMQRAPEDYPLQNIEDAFSRSYQNAVNSGREGQYLDRLNSLSHRLEKVQILETDEVDSILRSLSKE